MKEQDKPSKDLEKAAGMAAQKIYPYERGMKGLICENSIPIYKAGFIAGAEWQREKMKKEELEGEILKAINRYELEKKLKKVIDMKINIKDGIPANIALTAVLSVVNQAKTDENGKMVYPELTAVPFYRTTIMVKTETNRKSDCFRVWVKRN